ncbi:MAG TPA: hypothetical protein VGC76_10360 [Pyrinomonadaceae bacterium]|jgi:hypothetical protein
MKYSITFLLFLSIIFAPVSQAQKKNVATKVNPPMTARFIVKATYEENYTATKEAAGETLNHVNKLKIEVEASRWVVITKNEVGNVEFQYLPSGQPAAASGSVVFNAVYDSKTGSGTIHAAKSFSGELTAEMVNLSIPALTELGDGLGFNLELHNYLKGSCKSIVKSGDETINSNDCSDPAGMIMSGFDTYGENTAGKTAETPYMVGYGMRFELLPALYDIAKLKAKGELSETDSFAMQRLARLEEAYQQKQDGFSSQRWFGATTAGNSQSGYKITFTGEKSHPANGPTDDGGKQNWTQKLIVTADIIPNAATAYFDTLRDAPVFYLP